MSTPEEQQSKSDINIPMQSLQEVDGKEQRSTEFSEPPLTPIEQSLRDGWKKLIVSRTTAKVFLTLGSNVPWKNGEAIDAVNFLLKAINREFFNHDYGRNPMVGLTGMCICEPHMTGYGFRGQLHFHIILDGNPALKDINKFKEVVYKEMTRVKKNGLRIFTKGTVDVQEIEDIENLADYLTKTVRLRRWKRLENLCFVAPKGLEGVGVSYRSDDENY